MLRVGSRIHQAALFDWVFICGVALTSGVAAAKTPTSYVAAVAVLLLVAVVWLWRSREPFVPFLLLVAAMQGGALLQLPLKDAPIATLLPVLGGWAVLAVLLNPQPKREVVPVSAPGRLLLPSVVALGAVVVVTASAQAWRVDADPLSVAEISALVQLGVLVALTAYLLSNPQRVLWVGYVTVSVGVVLSVLALIAEAGIAPWITEVVYSGDYARSSGLVGDPNYFSFQLLLSLAFAASFAMASRTTRGRILTWSAFVLIFAGIISTYSAGALVGVAAVVAGTIVLQFRISIKRALVAFVLVAAATAVVAVMAPANYGEAVVAKYQKGITSGSFEQFGTKRGAAWEAAVREIQANPVLGVGLGSEHIISAVARYYTLTTVETRAAHNMYLSLAVGSGVFGLLAFLVILASCFHILWTTHSTSARDGPTETTLACACLFTALLVVVTQGLTLSLELEKFGWLVVGACFAVRGWSAARPEPTAAGRLVRP